MSSFRDNYKKIEYSLYKCIFITFHNKINQYSCFSIIKFILRQTNVLFFHTLSIHIRVFIECAWYTFVKQTKFNAGNFYLDLDNPTQEINLIFI